MGGIKNLEAKKKLNHVVSSGAGGGAKGPSIIDKRNEEVKCPYCDKVYTKAQSGRLQDHIKKQHAQELQQAEAGPSNPPAASNSAAVNNQSQSNRPESSKRTAKQETTLNKPQTSGTSSSKQQNIQATTAAASSNVKPSDGIMDIGSPAGYYKYKSPRLHLLEWSQREGRIKPRYQPRKNDDGTLTCKVVVPHPKKQDEDVVVFLDAKHASGAEGLELEQRAAVAALCKVAGDRNYHLLLPPQYVDMWHALKEAAQERKQAEARRAVVQSERAVRMKQRAARDAQRAPIPLPMSREKQALIQELIRGRDQANKPTNNTMTKAQRASVVQTVISDLSTDMQDMGFSAAQIQMAVEATVDTVSITDGTIAASSTSKEQILDWLLVHVASEQLPDRYTRGIHLTRPVTRIESAVGQLQQTGDDDNGDSETLAQQHDPAVMQLAEYGYRALDCKAALQAANGDMLSALPALYMRLTKSSAEYAKQTSGDISCMFEDGGSLSEEVMVLEAIYGEDVSIDREQGYITISQGITTSVSNKESKIKLHIWLNVVSSSGNENQGYPDQAPFLAISCHALAPSQLRILTRKLAAQAQSLLGQPMLHDLAAYLVEQAEHVTDNITQSDDEDAQETLDVNAAANTSLEGGSNYDEAEEESDGDDLKDSSYAVPSTAGSTQDLTDLGSSVQESESEDRGDQDEFISELVQQFEGAGAGDLGPTPDTSQQTTETSAPPQGLTSNSNASYVGRQPARGGRAQRSESEIAAENDRLQRQQQNVQRSPALADIRATRSKLPAAGMRAQLLQSLHQHAVLVISGVTGCGKSTQVPQYILEDAIDRGTGGATNIIVTQPRRISALGLAQRVAAERGEEVGETVGYSVRLDSKTSARTRLLFCTTGILLRRLLSDPLLSDVSHVVLDEVHERSIEIDLLLLLLRDVLIHRSTSSTPTPPLHLVLMSATADAQVFVDYMQQQRSAAAKSSPAMSVGQLTIPGFTYPVRELYLEDILERTGHVIGRSSKYAKRGSSHKEDANQGIMTALAAAGYSVDTQRSIACADQALINYDALAALVTHVVEQQQQFGAAACMDSWQEGLDALKKVQSKGAAAGAVLVFLPGAPEISRAARTLREHAPLITAAGGINKLRILPLHGSLSAKDQAAVFARPSAGQFKIVLATNVAETSITIDDVSFVIDTGRAKEMQHDVERGIMRLQEQWVSKAAGLQRRGRAGRVRPGVCFRLFSRDQWDHMPSHTPPEMLRSPLESVILLIKGMANKRQQQAESKAHGGKKVGEVLRHCMSPPDPQAVSAAVDQLQAMGALDEEEVLTALGQHLNQMPMDPRVGKMLVYGAMLGCLDPVLTVAAAMAHGRPVFLSPNPDQADTAAAARRPLLAAAMAARSDHIALVAAFNEWSRRVNGKGGKSEATALCQSCALSESSLEAVAAGRAEYAGVLADLGFLPRSAALLLRASRSRHADKQDEFVAWRALPVNANADDARFVKAAVMAGFYPSILRVQHPPTTYVKLEGAGAVEVDPDPKTVKFFDATRGRAFIHPSSVNFTVGKFNSGWIVYTQMVATSKLFVRESSMAPIYSLLLFGGMLHVNHEDNTVTVDDVARFAAPTNIGVLIRELRTQLHAVLARKVSDPGFEMTTDPTVSVVMQLLATDGY